MKYAAYGSNLHPRRLQLRTGEAKLVGTAAVEGFALKFHKRGSRDGSGKCNVVETDAGRVYLAVFEVPAAGLEELDIEEGVGAGYQRDWIDAGEYGRCLIYRAQDSHIEDSLLPFSWYKELVLAGCRVHGFPDDYLAAIDAVEATMDPDPARNALHMRLLEALEQEL